MPKSQEHTDLFTDTVNRLFADVEQAAKNNLDLVRRAKSFFLSVDPVLGALICTHNEVVKPTLDAIKNKRIGHEALVELIKETELEKIFTEGQDAVSALKQLCEFPESFTCLVEQHSDGSPLEQGAAYELSNNNDELYEEIKVDFNRVFLLAKSKNLFTLVTTDELKARLSKTPSSIFQTRPRSIAEDTHEAAYTNSLS